MALALVSVATLKVNETKADVPPSIGSSLALLGKPVFALAVIGIFLYVGVEVCMATFLLPTLAGLGFPAEKAALFGATLFFGVLTFGRLVAGVVHKLFANHRGIPTGGGGYLVASKLLSPTVGVVSGCALIGDYILTIALSVAAGADALFSLLPEQFQRQAPELIQHQKSEFALCVRGFPHAIEPARREGIGHALGASVFCFRLELHVRHRLGNFRSLRRIAGHRPWRGG